MGYDMYWTAKSGNDRFDTPYNERDYYFRANIWGMGSLRGIMDGLKILDWEVSPSFPVQPEDIDDEAWDAFYDLDIKDQLEHENPILREYAQAMERACSCKSSDETKVVGTKFCSNDGWRVTPEECKIIQEAFANNDLAAVQVTNAFGEAIEMDHDTLAWCRSFGEWCGKAAEHGGFRVY